MSGTWIFISLVFVAAFLLVWGFVVPVFGEARKMRKRLLARLGTVAAAGAQAEFASLLREKYLRELSPFERSLETLPGMARLTRFTEQSGRSTPAYRLVLLSAGLAAAADVIKRALKAGHPFSQCLKLVAEDMDEPISREFEKVFTEINYGSDVRSAMFGLLERMPSLSVMALVTVVMIQKETGGNLAETLERISAVIRGRFKLYRRVRTLSAEGRMSAWILAAIPFVLFGAISITTPNYMPMLLKDPRGPNLIMAAGTLGIVGILWLRRILRIDV